MINIPTNQHRAVGRTTTRSAPDESHYRRCHAAWTWSVPPRVCQTPPVSCLLRCRVLFAHRLLCQLGTQSGWDRSMAVSRQPLTAEALVRALLSPCGICGGQSGSETGFFRLLRFSPVNIIPPSLFILACHMGDDQQARWWPQFGDKVSTHRHEQDKLLLCERQCFDTQVIHGADWEGGMGVNGEPLGIL
jgi:hypothetical protein